MNVSIPQSDNAKVRAIKERYSLDLLSATVLERRGARSGEDLLYYLENDNSLSGIQQLLAQIKEKAFEARYLLITPQNVDVIAKKYGNLFAK